MTYHAPRRPGLWSRLSPWQRIGAVAAALLLPCCGGLTALGLIVGDPKTETVSGTPTAEVVTTTTAATAEPVLGDAAPSESSEPSEPSESPSETATKAPVVTTRTVRRTKTVRHDTREVEDDSLAEGRSKVRVKGVDGVRTITYEVTLTDGRETARRQVSSVVTRKPVTEVVAIGTKEAAGGGCDPNYTPCVPVASDVDCAGGSGNGPAYVDGPVEIIGSDVYDLDRDGDGVACDT